MHSIDIPDYLKSTNVELSRVLLSIPEFHEKNKLIPFYAAYEFPEKQQYLLAFWSKTFETVLQNYLKKKFFPMAFDDMIEEIFKRKQLILLDENCFQRINEKYKGHKEEELVQKTGYYGKIGSFFSYANPFSYFPKEKKQIFIVDNQKMFFIDMFDKLFQEFSTHIPFFFNSLGKNIVLDKDFNQYFHDTFGINSEDMDFMKNYLYSLQNIISKVNDIEIMGKFNDYIIYLKNFKNNDEMMKEKITFRMNGIIEKYEGILESAEKEISQCEEKIRILIKNNQKDNAKCLIQKKMLYKKRFDDVFNKKMVMQQAIFSLEDNFQNQSIMNALKELNAFTNNNKIDLAELDDLKNEIVDFNFNQKKASEMINDLDESDNVALEEEYNRIEQEVEIKNQFNNIPKVQIANKNQDQVNIIHPSLNSKQKPNIPNQNSEKPLNILSSNFDNKMLDLL